MPRFKSPKFTVTHALFDKAIDQTFSARLLRLERIKPPIKWQGKWWTVTTCFLSHQRSWAKVYEVIPLAEWEGAVYVYGCFDEDWIEERERSGLFWHGVKVQIENDAREFVLGAAVQWERADTPPAASEGQVE